MSTSTTPATTRTTILRFNSRYCQQLQARPLTTKAVTLVFFAMLNEQLASFFAGDIKKVTAHIPFTKCEVCVPHTVTSRVPLMGLFALLVNTPLTHYGYRLIQKLVPSPLTPRKRLLQILLSTGIITPVFCACFVSWIGLINNLSKIKDAFQHDQATCLLTKLRNSLRFVSTIILSALKSSFVKVASTSVVTSPVFMVLAQKFVIPEGWAVFFAFCYFIVGTYNNTRVKLEQKRQQKQHQERYTVDTPEKKDS